MTSFQRIAARETKQRMIGDLTALGLVATIGFVVGALTLYL